MMIRLVGILTGSAIAVAMLIVVLGIPEFARPDRPEPGFAETTPQVEQEAPAMTMPDAIALVDTETVTETPAAADAEIFAQPEPEYAPPSQPDEIAYEPVALAEQEQELAEQHWYAFWSPFRSEIAADGFVSQLQRTTGLDYRVVKLKPGVYEVAFAYSDDADIQDKLMQISSATGLDLSGG